MGGGVNIVGEVERVDGRALRYVEFVDSYMKSNRPVLLTGLMDSWKACADWTIGADNHDGTPRSPNLQFFKDHFPSPLVQVADCSTREFTDQKRLEMSMVEFINRWVGQSLSDSSNASGNHGCADSLLYLKDWHFVKEYPGYVAYTTPVFFADDWLNMYLDSHPIHRDSDISHHKNEINCADYRFVYMGTKGTWTPLHADVFRSYSWSANVCGRKLWLFLPPSQSNLLFDRNLRSSVYSVNDDVSEKQFPGFKKTEWLECIQEQNEMIFVPSGWYHQVHNLEDTISINHNWFNAYNLSWVWNLLHEDYKVAKEYIEDIRDICDDFEGLCQRNLAANTGMNFYDFFIFITRFALANVIELYHIQKKENSALSSAESASNFFYNLMSIRTVALRMQSAEAFSPENLSLISEENKSAFSDIKKILEEESFSKLSMALSKAYDYIAGEKENCLEIRNSYKNSCFSINCTKSNCDVVDQITASVCKIRGPKDLVMLVDHAVSDSCNSKAGISDLILVCESFGGDSCSVDP